MICGYVAPSIMILIYLGTIMMKHGMNTRSYIVSSYLVSGGCARDSLDAVAFDYCFNVQVVTFYAATATDSRLSHRSPGDGLASKTT